MALNANVTLKRLIAEIKEWSDDHKMIEGFGYGDFLELYQEGENTYPFLMVNASNAGSDKWYIKYQLEFGVMDWVWDDRENFQRVESDTMEIIRDFQNTIEESPRWQAFCKINGDITDRKFVEKGGDKVTGWGATINLWVKRKSGFCDLQAIMPEYDFQSGNVIVASCEPVTGSFNGDVTISTPSGEDKAIIVQTKGGSPVLAGDIKSDNKNEIVIEVDAPGTLPLNSGPLFKSGSDVSFQDLDDGDLQQGVGVDIITLDHLNKYGNDSRYTDTLGGQTYANSIMVDHKTEDQVAGKIRCYYLIVESAATLTVHIDNQPFTKAGIAGWTVCNSTQILNLFNQSLFRSWLNYAPINHNVLGTATRLWTSSRESTSVGKTYAGSSFIVAGHGAVSQAMVTMELTYAQLGITL